MGQTPAIVVVNLEKEDIIALDPRAKAFLEQIAAAGTPIFDTIEDQR